MLESEARRMELAELDALPRSSPPAT
jgi:hypothetical protein